MFEKTLTKSLLVGLLTALFIMATGCAQGNSSGGGEASGNMLVSFSGAATSSVTSAQAVITAPDISPDIVVELAVGSGQAGGVILGIPAGLGRQITVNAYENAQLLCTGSALVDILAGQTVQVAMVPQCQDAGAETGGVLINGQMNYPPQISSVFASAASVPIGGQVALSVSATDPDGDSLSYLWAATCGSVEPADQFQAQWIAPVTFATTCTLTVTVSDNRAGQKSLSFDLATQAARIALTGLSASCIPGGNGLLQLSLTGEGFDGPSGTFSEVYVDITATINGQTLQGQRALPDLSFPDVASPNEILLYQSLMDFGQVSEFEVSLQVSVPSAGFSTGPLLWSQADVREYCAPVAALAGAVLLAGSAPIALAVGDFGGGSGRDLAVLDGAGNALQVLWNDWTGAFPSADQITVDTFPAAPSVLLAAALDPALAGDEIVVGVSDGVVRVYGRARASYNLIAEIDFAAYAGAQQINAVAAADEDGDGDLDLAVAVDNGIGIVVNDGGSFMIIHFIAYASGVADLAVADLSGDGSPDRVILRPGEAPLVLFGDPGRSEAVFALFGTPEHLVLGDFDANGAPDVAIDGSFLEPAAAPLLVFFNDGTGQFGHHDFGADTLGETRNLMTAIDSNSDGVSEILTAQGNRVDLIFPQYNFLGGGRDVLAVDLMPRDLQNAVAVAAGDLNGDGLLDFAAADSAASEVRIYWGKNREALP